MSFFNRKKPDEFISEMPPNEYDDEEYYGEEEGEYAEDEEYEEDYDEDEGGAPAPKKNVVKTALMGVAALAVVGVGGFSAVNFFAPEMTESLVNSMPWVTQSAEPEPGSEQFTDVPGEAAPPDGQVAPPPDDVTASADVAAVPPAPAKPQPVKPTAAAPKPAPVKATPKPMAAKPPAKKWTPTKKWTPKPAPVARAWTPRKSTWKPRATTRYARYYAPKKSRWTRYGRTYTARPSYGRAYYGRYKYRSAYSNAKRTRYAAPRKYAVQVGSFANPANATQLASQLRAQGVSAYVSGNGGYGSGHLVRSVAVRNRANAQRLLTQYRAAGYPSRIVPVGNGLVAVSAGVYSSPQRAQAVVGNLNQRGLYATSGYTPGVNTGNGPSRVYIGSYASRAAAAAKMRQLQNQGIPAAVTTVK